MSLPFNNRVMLLEYACGKPVPYGAARASI
jgi:hypothetical protein